MTPQDKREVKNIVITMLAVAVIVAGLVAFAGLLIDDLKTLRRGAWGILIGIGLLFAVSKLIKTDTDSFTGN